MLILTSVQFFLCQIRSNYYFRRISRPRDKSKLSLHFATTTTAISRYVRARRYYLIMFLALLAPGLIYFGVFPWQSDSRAFRTTFLTGVIPSNDHSFEASIRTYDTIEQANMHCVYILSTRFSWATLFSKFHKLRWSIGSNRKTGRLSWFIVPRSLFSRSSA